MRTSSVVLALLASVFVTACSTSAKTYYYTLQSGQSGQTDTPTAKEPAANPRLNNIAISALSLPEIVDRPQLVLRSGETQVLISDNHLWGQALKSEITRNLAAHLARETGAAHVILPGQAGLDDAEIKLAVDILRFDSVLGGAATIEARWSVLRKGVAKSVSGYALVRETASAAGYDAIVAAHSRALARLSRDMAATLKP